MAFEAPTTSNTQVDGEERKVVDWDAYQKYMVSACNLSKEKTVVGVTSGIIDLGLQEQDHAKMEWKGSPEQEVEELKKYKGSWFEDDPEDGKRYKCWKKKPVSCVAFTVDIPGIMVDKAPFFEEGASNPAPLRLLLNGTFYRKEVGCMDVGRLYSLDLRKNEKTGNKWSFLPANAIYKMALGAGLIDSGDPFLPQDIIKLLGKPLFFKASVSFNDKGYYNEKISYIGPVVEGMTVPPYDAESLLYSVGFGGNNTDTAIQFLTSPVINRMKLSSQYLGSGVRKEIERIHPYQAIEDGEDENSSSDAPQDKQEDPKPSKKKGGNTPKPTPPTSPKDEDIDMIPF